MSELDPNAQVKGARDPLGTQSVWSAFARQVIGNLTTQTTSLNDFRVLLIGSWLIDQSIDQDVPRESVFVAWEQLASYARLVVGKEGGFRGVRGAQRNLDRPEPIMISSDRASQTLSNQAAYGIWGLYTAAASRSGMLVFDRPLLLTDAGRHLVETVYLPTLDPCWGKGASELIRWVTQGHKLDEKKHRAKLGAIATCIGDPLTVEERQYYRTTIVHAGYDTEAAQPLPSVRRVEVEVQRRQIEMAAQLRRLVPRGETVGRLDVEQIVTETEDKDLAERLEDTLAAESMLAASIHIFNYISNQPGAKMSAIVNELQTHFKESTLLTSEDVARLKRTWTSNPHLLATVGDEDGKGADRWLEIAQALQAKNFKDLVTLLIRQNELVTRDRGGTVGWVSISPSDKIEVRLSSAGPALPDPTPSNRLWINGYFFTNLLTLARAVEGADGNSGHQ